MIPLVLASRSPRRLELLRLVGIEPEVVPTGIPEDAFPGEGPRDLVLRLAREKAWAVASGRPSGQAVLGADTLVTLDGIILGQPADRTEAESMLRTLSGRTHTVFTGIHLVRTGGGEASGASESAVTFHRLSAAEIAWYIDTGEPMDKAGAYAAQGVGAVFLEAIAGSFHNVVGLPLDLLYRLLPEVGLDLGELVSRRGSE